MSDRRRYARRRRAAVPAALAAFVMLVVVTGSHPQPTWAGGEFTPAMTIVLQQQAAEPASEPVADVPLDEPPLDPVPLDDGGDAGDLAASADEPADAGDVGTETTGDDGGEDEQEPQPAIRRVFLVVLAQTDLVALADDAAAAPWFASTLVPQGTLLTRYASVARGSLANGVALVSGQGPTQQTLADCPAAAGGATPPDVPDVLGDDAQQLGDGCLYPFATGTVADQLTGAGLDWRAYVEGAASACPATPRNPFAFFHAQVDEGGACARRVGGLDRLDADLARGSRAPALLYVVPDACHDGRPEPCPPAGSADPAAPVDPAAPPPPAGPAAADAFLRDVVERILASPAYEDGGLIVVTSDGPPAPDPAGAPAPAIAPPVPATYPNAGDAAAAGAGRVGALLISAQVAAGRRSDAPASHFTLLRAISDLFALQPLGYAGTARLEPLPESVLPLENADGN